MNLKDFVKLASWTSPLALIPHRSLNTINAVTSLATFFGQDLDILRSSDLFNAHSKPLEEEELLAIEHNLKDYTRGANLEAYV